MTVSRWINGHTGANAQALLGEISDPAIMRVILFATAARFHEGFSDSDGPESNLPLLAAATVSAQGDVKIYDGVFLTAARRPRYLEVRDVLDAAERSEKVFFGNSPAPFTSGLEPMRAWEQLSRIIVNRFSVKTRASFFSLLSALSEKELERLV